MASSPPPLDVALSLPIAVVALRLPISRAVRVPRGLFCTRAHAAFHASLGARHLGALMPRRSDAQRWEFPSPWSLRRFALEPGPRGSELSAELVLFGTHAVEARGAAEDAFADVVIDVGGGAHDASTGGVSRREVFVGSLDAWCRTRASEADPPRGLVVELVEPFDTRGEPFSLASTTSGVALLLHRWALEESGFAGEAGHEVAKASAEACANAVRAAVSALPMQPDVRERRLTERTSSSNGHRFPLRGWQGRVVVSGDATPVFPWLEALSLRGGRHRKFGMSEVEILRRDS